MTHTQIIGPGRQKGPSFSERLSAGLGKGLEFGSQIMQQKQAEQQMQKENEKFFELTGMDISGIRDPKMRQEAFSSAMQQQEQRQKNKYELAENDRILRDLEEKRKLESGSLNAYRKDPKMAEQVSRPAKEKEPSLTEKPVPKEISRSIKKIVADNPKANADELRILMDEANIPPVYSNPYTENRRRTEEQQGKTSEERRRALRQETLPIRTEIANKAKAAENGIRNKHQLMEIIEKGDINDPTFAALAEALPLNLGKRMLSNDTVEYKAGLVEEFGDLRNIFQGQTRVKEIELLENKIADIYLDDDQKKAILKSRINALKADVIRAEAAAEIEDKELGVLQFEKEVEKRAKPKLEALFNQILDEQKIIIERAESKKEFPLDANDADDLKILQQILKEAGGDKTEARKIAKKKGYKF